MASTSFSYGIENLLRRGGKRLRGRRVGLLAHPASIDTQGRHASSLLHDALGSGLVALFGPEHGYYGRGGAGEEIGHATHPGWNIPIHSLYGAHRRPTAEMLAGLDVLLFDLQDIAERCYTFVSSLRYVMEECARHNVELIVCDRPVPLPDTVDGPFVDPGCESFVGDVPVPLVYGMTPGETALFLRRNLGIEVKLDVARMTGYSRGERRGTDWGPWVSPSPGIRTWETGWVYAATVFGEALPCVQYGRGSLSPFASFCVAGLDADRFAAELNRRKLPGVRFDPHWAPEPGVALRVTHPARFKPVLTGIALIDALHKRLGAERVWGEGSRPEFFDKLMGTPFVREALLNGKPWRKAADFQGPEMSAFLKLRRECLLYGRGR